MRSVLFPRRRKTIRLFRFIGMVSVLYMGVCICPERSLSQNCSRFHSSTNGYSLLVPNEWIRVPNVILQAAYNETFSTSVRADLVWEAAFGQAGADGPFQCPYIVLQIMRYSSLGLRRQPRKDEINNILTAFTGLDLDEIARRTLEPRARDSVVDLKPGDVFFDEASMSYSFGLEMGRADGGKIRSIVAGHLGKTCVVQLMFYDLFENWHNSIRERECILHSFQFDSDMAYDEAQALSPNMSKNLRTVFGKGVGGALAAIALCLGIGFVRLTASMIHSRSTSDTKEEDSTPTSTGIAENAIPHSGSE